MMCHILLCSLTDPRPFHEEFIIDRIHVSAMVGVVHNPYTEKRVKPRVIQKVQAYGMQLVILRWWCRLEQMNVFLQEALGETDALGKTP